MGPSSLDRRNNMFPTDPIIDSVSDGSQVVENSAMDLAGSMPSEARLPVDSGGREGDRPEGGKASVNSACMHHAVRVCSRTGVWRARSAIGLGRPLQAAAEEERNGCGLDWHGQRGGLENEVDQVMRERAWVSMHACIVSHVVSRRIASRELADCQSRGSNVSESDRSEVAGLDQDSAGVLHVSGYLVSGQNSEGRVWCLAGYEDGLG